MLLFAHQGADLGEGCPPPPPFEKGF